jgi:leader peptidase (prepilin peptidase) / N-methyltransferase
VLEVLQTPGFGYPLAAILGLLFGSFGNVVIHRIPKMLEREWAQQCAELRGEIVAAEASPRYNLMVPGSACPTCGHQITALENIPIVSWLVLRGRCSGCKASISARYPLVELASGLLFLGASYKFGLTGTAVAACGYLFALLVLSGIDLDTQLLPDQITVPLAWAGLIVNSFGLFTDWRSALWGAVVGYLALWAVYWMFKLVTGKEGMGYGDFKLLAAIGAWLGWQHLPAVILIASVVGAVVGVALMFSGKLGKGMPMPFGPFLAAAGVIAMFFGQHLIGLYIV